VLGSALGSLSMALALYGLKDAGAKYENFLLVIAYWIGPRLGVYLTGWALRRRQTATAAPRGPCW